ncbi:nitrous oxide reductase accessory protein NosL [Rhodoferax sp.]|uniref:nitrous oxide reductase accessory protein NosL n=1 Tax=Rhodoferax sp. TaxID=50421 RepID=UPI002624A70A|nr:nitrous oxide reductase accessory protein NosL [Rhodoferax sp.]MDD3935094.1 nitrous oxide reductase accessory protein NosL [Rhodoferax sp.]
MRRRHLILVTTLGGLAATASVGWLAWRPNTARADEAIDDVCIVAPTFAYDPASGVAPTAAREVPAEARCPVCGMFPARNRRWAAQVIFSDGAVQYLDSPLSLFHYLQRVERYTPGRATADIVALYVSDQATGDWLGADQAIYVHGSTLPGPMRAGNLPAYASEANARALVKVRGGALTSAVALRQSLPPGLQKLAPHAHPDG